MPGPLTAPYGELAAVGVNKETTFATFPGTSGMIFHASEDFTATPANKLIKRTGARKRRGQSQPIVDGYVGKASFMPECDGDTIGQLLAYALGAQTAPALATFVNTTTTTSTTIATPATFTPASLQGIQPGQSLSIDTAAQQETITVIAVQTAAGTFTANATKTHGSGVVIVGTATTAKNSVITLGQIPSFSMQVQRAGIDTIDYLGCKVNGLSLSFDKGKGLTPKVDLLYATEVVDGSPASPTYSTKNPFPYVNPLNYAVIFGSLVGFAGSFTVHKLQIDLKNNLVADYYSVGSGSRSVVDFPQQQADVMLKATLGFESNLAYQKFLGATTAPAAAVPPVKFDIGLWSTDVIEASNSLNYGIELITNGVIETHSAPIKSGSIIYQDISVQCGESANGANDDLKIVLTNLASAVY